MTKEQLIEHYTRCLREAERERDEFNDAVNKYGLRVIHRVPGSPERDVTDETRRSLDDSVNEYRTMLREGSSLS